MIDDGNDDDENKKICMTTFIYCKVDLYRYTSRQASQERELIDISKDITFHFAQLCMSEHSSLIMNST